MKNKGWLSTDKKYYKKRKKISVVFDEELQILVS